MVEAIVWLLTTPEAIVWWLTIELIGAVAFPMIFLLLRFLPDRGYAFSKIVGLLLVSYLLWLGASVHLIPNERWSIILVLALMSVSSSVLLWLNRHEIADFMRRQWTLVAFNELLFTAAFAVALLLRAQTFDFLTGEKPSDLAFINALSRADYFPPEDPWLAGHAVNYYYFGHLTVASLTKLTSIPSHLTFNLALALFVALSASAAFGIAYNLIAARARAAAAMAFALVSPFLLLVLSNIEGLFELLAIHGVGSKGFYATVDIAGLDGLRESAKWYPTEWLWYLRGMNIAGTGVDRQFPLVKFAIGELHSENLAIPFVLLTIASALNIWRSNPVSRLISIDVATLLFAALALGSVAVVQTWYAPPLFGLLVATFALRSYLLEPAADRRWIARSTAFSIGLALTAVLLFAPFYRLNYSAFKGIDVLPGQYSSQPQHLLYMWLPLLWLAASLALLLFGKMKASASSLLAGFAAPLAVFGAWAGMVALEDGVGAIADAAADRNVNWVSALILAALLFALVYGLSRHLGARSAQEPDNTGFVLILAALAALILLGVEFFFIDDGFIAPASAARNYNTLIKVNYMAWFLLSISGAYAVYYFLTKVDASRLLPTLARGAWVISTILVVSLGLIYTVMITFYLTNGFENDRNLNVLWGLEQNFPAEYAAIRWLDENVSGTPVIAEAVGNSWTGSGRISAYTGLPTVLGWREHEFAWRGGLDAQAGRDEAVARIYQTTDPGEATALLEQFSVEYVYVGGLERYQYGEAGLGKFATFMDIAFQQGDVTIYTMRRATAGGLTSNSSGPRP